MPSTDAREGHVAAPAPSVCLSKAGFGFERKVGPPSCPHATYTARGDSTLNFDMWQKAESAAGRGEGASSEVSIPAAQPVLANLGRAGPLAAENLPQQVYEVRGRRDECL